MSTTAYQDGVAVEPTSQATSSTSGTSTRAEDRSNRNEPRVSAARRDTPTGRRSETTPLVLVAHGEPVMRRTLRVYLESSGYRIIEASGGRQAVALLSDNVDVAMVDLSMQDVSGMDCISHIRKQSPHTQVIAICVEGGVRNGIAAMKHGAFQFLVNPLDREQLLVQLRQAVAAGALVRENRMLREVVGYPTAIGELAGSSPSMRSLRKQMEAFTQLDSTVLITGARGTGKTRVGQWIHNNGPRASHPLAVVHCGALATELIEVELFGYTRGAFNGATSDRPGRAELAHGGTLLLDDVDRLPVELQEKVLGLLRDRLIRRIGSDSVWRVDVRIIATSSRDLAKMCRRGEFLEDLFFRLNVLSLHLATLKERTTDIPALSYELLRRSSQRRGCPPPALTNDAVESLQQYAWPGNIRELDDVLQRASQLSGGSFIRAVDLPINHQRPGTSDLDESDSMGLAGMTMAEIERRAVVETIRSTGGNKAKAARQLEVSEKTIYNKIKQYNLAGEI